MTSNEVLGLLPLCDVESSAKDFCVALQAETYPGIDNQMKTHLYGPWLEYDYSEAFAENEARLESLALCPGGNHCWIDDSHGGPESGYVAGHCPRCGKSFHYRLY